jgi:hypothetical protein
VYNGSSLLADLNFQSVIELYKNFTRMSPSEFEFLINLIGEKISKKGTAFRKAISGFICVQSIPVVFINAINNQVKMYECIQSNTTQGRLYYNVLTHKPHVSVFYHRSIIRLICEMFSIQM